MTLKGHKGEAEGEGGPGAVPLAFTFPAGFQSRPTTKVPTASQSRPSTKVPTASQSRPTTKVPTASQSHPSTKASSWLPEAAYSAVAMQKARNTLPQILEKSSPICYSIKKRFHPPASKQARYGGIYMKLEQLLERLEYTCVQGSLDREISGIANDSCLLYTSDAADE